jgi:nucleoside-diphosphate-sugar epimerase
MILDNLEIKVEEKTTRYFIDIEDVVESLTPIILSKSQNSKTFNVCFNTKIGVIDFINIMAKELEKDPRIILLNQGCSLNIDNKNFLELVDEKFRSIGPDYNYKIIKKYS